MNTPTIKQASLTALMVGIFFALLKASLAGEPFQKQLKTSPLSASGLFIPQTFN
jgi:hypothetical protein